MSTHTFLQKTLDKSIRQFTQTFFISLGEFSPKDYPSEEVGGVQNKQIEVDLHLHVLFFL